MKFQIKSRFDNSKVIFECELDVSFKTKDYSFQLGAAVIAAYKSRADLHGADLRGAYLRGADLRGADLRGADLRGADLYGADLHGADLRGAYLRGADLRGADGKKILLVGKEPIISVGGIGSRNDYLLAYNTEKGIYVKVGCYFNTIENFKFEVNKKHKDNIHAKEYAVAIKMIEEVFTARNAIKQTEGM